MTTLKCIFQNVNSLISLNKRYELDLFLNRHRPDVMLIAEHRLATKHSINFKHYQFIRQQAPATHTVYAQRQNSREHGMSVAICVKNGIEFERIQIGPLRFIEAVAIKLSYIDANRNSRNFIAVSLYKRPNDPLQLADLKTISDSLTRTQNGGHIIIGCDLNCKHPSWHVPLHNPAHQNRDGEILYNWLLGQPGFVLHPTKEPSRPNSHNINNPSSIDYFIHSVELPIDINEFCEVTNDFPSDHFGVKFTIRLGEYRLLSASPKIVHNFNRINSLAWNTVLLRNLIPITNTSNQSPSEIDHHVNNLNVALNSAIDSPSAIPKITICPSKPNSRAQLSRHCLELIKQKRYLRRYLFRHQFSLSDTEKEELRSVISDMTTQINTHIQVSELKHIEDNLKRIHPSKISLKSLQRSNQFHQNDEPLKHDICLSAAEHGGIDINVPLIIKSKFEKVNALAWSFEQIHKQNDNMTSQSTVLKRHKRHVNREVKNFIGPQSGPASYIMSFDSNRSADGNWPGAEELGFTNAKQLFDWISCKNSKKTMGPDGSSNYLLKHCNFVVLKHLATLFNHCFNASYFPTSWKCSKVIPIPKPKANPQSLQGYRPISILSAISLLFEKMLMEHIKKHIESQQILKPYQFGFRSSLSISHSLAVANSFIYTNLSRKRATIACALDFEKAFDTVWKNGLIFKMNNIFQFNPNTTRIIYSYLSSRSFYVNSPEGIERSLIREITAGVPQGSLLAPILYNIYLADMPDFRQDPNSTSTARIQPLVYADDILLLSSGAWIASAEMDLNSYLDQLCHYFSKWRLKLNTNKCEGCIFRGARLSDIYKNARKFKPKLYVNGNIPIQMKNHLKYLGVIYDDKLNFKLHFEHTLKKAKIQLQQIYHIFRPLSSSNPSHNINEICKLRALAYKKLIQPILIHGHISWFNIKSSQMEIMRLFERRILRRALGNSSYDPHTFRYISNSMLYKTTTTKRLDTLFFRIIEKFVDLNQHSRNQHICNSVEQIRIPFEYSVDHITINHISHLKEKGIIFDSDNNLIFYHRKSNSIDPTDGLSFNINQ